MAKFRSIIDTHNEMLKVIPPDKRDLITDLTNFINKCSNNTPIYLTARSTYSDYLQVLWKHVPKRPLKLSDPNWVWNCQEVFSSSEIGS
jgi:hypothetical protein